LSFSFFFPLYFQSIFFYPFVKKGKEEKKEAKFEKKASPKRKKEKQTKDAQ
jgi:hypothetical protein